MTTVCSKLNDFELLHVVVMLLLQCLTQLLNVSLFILFIYLLRGLVTPILRNEINENTTSNKRATVLSIRSLIIRISFAISAPILGYIADNYSLAISFYGLAIVVGFFSILSAIKLYRIR